MKIAFWKMHGAGNDFILIDDRDRDFPARDTAWLKAICARRTGIGCEGLILIQPSECADFRMRFFNPDGCEASMCGNASRCVARLASEQGMAGRDMSIETAAGMLTARVMDGHVGVTLTNPTDWECDIELELQGQQLSVDLVNTGVPHAVAIMDDIRTTDVAGLGRLIRNATHFAPAGTNADFVTVVAPDTLRLRTYERGVEMETLACGTGVAAAAVVAARRELVKSPVQVVTAGGYALTVTFDRTASATLTNVRLTGPAEHVFHGELDYTPSS